MITAATFRKFLLPLLLAGSILVGFTGCVAKSEDESTIPWSRPASWEGGLPGMSPGMGGG